MALPPLKPLSEQRVVITGASSGIGRITARRFAEAGARVVLAARDTTALEELAATLGSERAIAVPTDVADEAGVKALAQRAVAAFGGIDTWVNNAGISVYARFEEIPADEFRRVVEVDFFGQVYGCRTAVPILAQEGRGAVICVGSVASARGIPLQSPYCASKHAIKGLVESLRVEQQQAGTGVEVTLIEPYSIDTPFFAHSGAHMRAAPRPMPPVYTPDLVAEAILHAATRRTRTLPVGGASAMTIASNAVSPGLMDRFLALTGARSQQMPEQPRDGAGQLFAADGNGAERGGFAARGFSVYTWARLHPRTALISGATALGIAGGALRARR
jgi:NAD(P)-dependent dehydrogenase (short-subunit alcohol dehydrogenase family)